MGYLKNPKLRKKEPNANCSKCKASEEFLHVPLLTGVSLPPQRLLRLRRRRYQPYLLESPQILKRRAKTIQNSQNYSKTIYDINFVVPENLKKRKKVEDHIILF